jgi:DNA-directed RNA polymerase specialized sigma24 family protein
MKPNKIIPFLPVIETVVHSFLGRFELSKRDEIQDKIFDKLLAIEYQGTNPDKIKAKIITIAKNECRDFLRLVRIYGRDILWGTWSDEMTLDMLRGTKRKWYKRKPRPRFREVKKYLIRAGYGGRIIKHLEIYQAWCNRMSRKQMAKKFRLSEDQVRGRLANLRKKILLILNKSTTSK